MKNNKQQNRYYDSISDGYDELYGNEQKKKLDLIKGMLTIKKDELLLDVGCGTGISSDFECKVFGIDPSWKLITKSKSKNFVVVQARAESIPFMNSSFDLVISLTAVQNFENMKMALDEIIRVGKRKFVLSILKKSKKLESFKNIIKSAFTRNYEISMIEEEKDIIYFIGIDRTV